MFCKRQKQDEATQQSRKIDIEIENDRKQQRDENRLLLLGAGECGKTTIIKQMQIIHINGFTTEEKLAKVPYIRHNLQESIYSIVWNMDKLELPITLTNDKSKESAEFILRSEHRNAEDYTDVYYNHVITLWSDPQVRAAFDRSNEYQLIDSSEQFLNRINEIKRKDYVPSIEDILFCRITTTSISNIKFQVPVPKKYGGGVAKFLMYDVGGQRGHRKKWISVFEGIDAILFIIAASDFDLKLREDENCNRLHESFKVFKEIVWSRFLRNAGMIVFLNKQDLLKKKIEAGKKMEPHFPEYKSYKTTEANSEYDRAKLFMKEKLLEVNKNKPDPIDVGLLPGFSKLQELEDRELFIHFTTATDTNNIKRVFESVHGLIITRNLGKAL